MKKLVAILFVIFAISQVFAQSSEVFTTLEGAIHGYDPVAYFREGKPVKGTERNFLHVGMELNGRSQAGNISRYLKQTPENMHRNMAGTVPTEHQKVIRRPLDPMLLQL